MKKLLFCIAVLSLVSAGASAQKSMDDELNSELDKMYEQSKTQSTTTNANVSAPKAQAQVTVLPSVASPTPVLVQAPQVQKQAVTIIEATPLVESKADRLRKARQETELVTEQKIVEKLETSRMEDEKKRAEVLFGDRFNALTNNSQQVAPAATPLAAPIVAPVVVAPPVAAPVVAAPIPAVVAAPVVVSEAPVVTEKKEDRLSRDDVRQELRAALDESKVKDEAKKIERKTFFSLMGGMGDYNNNNITGQYALGMGFGQKINDRLIVEGQFAYSDYHVQNGDGLMYNYTIYPRISNMEQYQAILAAKYQLLGGSFRPIVGVATAYTYRQYSDIQFGNSGDTGNSSAFDLGVLCGADLEVSENFAIGLEVRYLWNVMNRTQINNSLTPSQVYIGSSVTPENMGNMNIGITSRISF